MKSIESKINRAIESNKLSPEILGERNWFNYFIKVSELIWSRSNYDGYLIVVYKDYSKIEHLASVQI